MYLLQTKKRTSLYKYNGNLRDSILCSFGKLATETHYTNKEMNIEYVTKEVVIEKSDKKKENRKQLFESYLRPPKDQTVSQNILNANFCGIKKP